VFAQFDVQLTIEIVAIPEAPPPVQAVPPSTVSKIKGIPGNWRCDSRGIRAQLVRKSPAG
jgi:hypothetical protein